ncbi:MAG: hypothetical protein M1369_06950 [Deinococcus sp.]|nr:hypothetical protein [Deinococcus sp.]MCL5965501.1 hypothetical protein [Deinococcus sp.]
MGAHTSKRKTALAFYPGDPGIAGFSHTGVGGSVFHRFVVDEKALAAKAGEGRGAQG